MRLRRLLPALSIAAIAAACGRAGVPQPSFTLPDQLLVRVDGRVQPVLLDTYVLGSILAEASVAGESAAATSRIFEVQAVLARTYAVASLGRHRAEGFNLCDSTHCQVYRPSQVASSPVAPAARRAVARTRGRLLVFGSRPVEALFHADCGGHTAAAIDVWGHQSVPYLVGSPDNVPSAAHNEWTLDLPADQVRHAFNAQPESHVGARLDRIIVTDRDGSGRAVGIELVGERTVELRGERFRAVLNAAVGGRAIRSTRMTIARDGPRFRFTGTGWGHGVGLCQTGAAARARLGQPVEAILAAYYPGARLVRLR